MSRILFTQFGMEFARLVFTEVRLKKELDKAFVQTVAIKTPEAVGSATLHPCTVVHLPGEGRPESERVFNVFIPFQMTLRVSLMGFGNESYNVNGRVQMRLWLEAREPLVMYLNGKDVPAAAVTLTAEGNGNWLNLDIAKAFGMERILREKMAKQFNEEFSKSSGSRTIDILSEVNKG